jgi:hypothetical protein
MRPHRLFLALILAAAYALPVSAQDVLTAGTTSASSGTTVGIPIYLQDVNGTPLGTDAGTGNRIQAISFQITFSTAAVTAASFTRAGVLTGLTPLYEQTVNGTGSISWLASFLESSQPIPLTANAPIPGNRIGTLTLTLAGGLPNGSIVALAFNPDTTLLSNQGGTLTETTFSHTLNLTGGSVTVGGAGTTTTLNNAPNPSTFGQTVTLTAGVTSGTAGTITGFVSFYDGAQLIGFAPVLSGQATLATSSLAQGGHSISATYEGDANYHASTSPVVSQTVNPGTPPPMNVVATGTSSTTATITWSAVGGATSYEVRRSVNGGAFSLVGSPAGPSFNDSGLTPDREYLYVVRALGALSGTSPDSAVDIATTTMFTDDPLVAGTTPFKAIHLTELRTAANALRVSAGLGTVTFTDPSVGPTTNIRTLHVEELRSAILQARGILGLPVVSFTDAPLTIGATPMKALHFQQLRDALK